MKYNKNLEPFLYRTKRNVIALKEGLYYCPHQLIDRLIFNLERTSSEYSGLKIYKKINAINSYSDTYPARSIDKIISTSLDAGYKVEFYDHIDTIPTSLIKWVYALKDDYYFYRYFGQICSLFNQPEETIKLFNGIKGLK